MKAEKVLLHKLLEGDLQYIVPHFQRSYSWKKDNWEILWNDLLNLSGINDQPSDEKEHFLGAFVTSPTEFSPEEISKFILIDGQQRITSLFIILIALKNQAIILDDKKNQKKISKCLINEDEDSNDRYKLILTQGDQKFHNDKEALIALINNKQALITSHIYITFEYFTKLIQKLTETEVNNLFIAITKKISLVSIVLDKDDDPYTIFESLNAKGQPLSQADLIRNLFFMCIKPAEHEYIYHQKWQPMENMIDQKNMTEFIRHYLVKNGSAVKTTDVYARIKHIINHTDVHLDKHQKAKQLLDDLIIYADYYAKFLDPKLETDPEIADTLARINRFKATVCYPFFLNIFHLKAQNKLNKNELIEILTSIENFIVRRYICEEKRSELNHVFIKLYTQLERQPSILEGLKDILSSRNYPSDNKIIQSLKNNDIYGKGDRIDRVKFLLERIEYYHNPKELVNTENVSIEHIMPQTLNNAWKQQLGEDFKIIQHDHLHKIGNLTLTAYNSELSNKAFLDKKPIYRNSKLSLNKWFNKKQYWDANTINARTAALSQLILKIYPHLSENNIHLNLTVTGKKPKKLTLKNKSFVIKTWVELIEVILEQTEIIFGENERNNLLKEFPRYLSKNKTGKIHFNKGINAQSVYQLCKNIFQFLGIPNNDWNLELKSSST